MIFLNNKIILFALFLLLFLFSCSVEPEISDAGEVSIEEIIESYNYYGFKVYYNEYEPHQEYADSIKMLFKPETHKYILYTSPSCFSCGQTDSLLPYACKVIRNIGLNDSCFYLFDTPKVSSGHPFDTIINLERLPSAYVKKADEIYSLLDTLRVRRNQSDDYIPIEQIMLELIK